MYLAHYISHWKKSNLGIIVYLYTMRRDQFELVARYQIKLHLMMNLVQIITLYLSEAIHQALPIAWERMKWPGLDVGRSGSFTAIFTLPKALA